MNTPKGTNFLLTTVTVGAASVNILSEKVSRQYLIIQNTHATQSLFINFGVAAAITDLEIIPGGNYEPLTAPYNTIFAISSGVGTTVIIVWG